MARPIYEIAFEIEEDWKPVHYTASPYLSAMKMLKSPSEGYGYDSATSIIRYFLSNASTWRGEVARRIKKELNGLLK